MSRLASKTFRASLALLLSLWITGAGCMFGCGEMMAASAAEPAAPSRTNSFATVVSGDACASHSGHDCCAKKKAAEKPAVEAQPRPAAKPSLRTATLVSRSESVSPNPGRGMSECPLATSRAVVATPKARDRKQLVAAIMLPAKAAALPTAFEFHAAVSPIARLPNRGHTYLRCCAFLI